MFKQLTFLVPLALLACGSSTPNPVPTPAPTATAAASADSNAEPDATATAKEEAPPAKPSGTTIEAFWIADASCLDAMSSPAAAQSAPDGLSLQISDHAQGKQHIISFHGGRDDLMAWFEGLNIADRKLTTWTFRPDFFNAVCRTTEAILTGGDFASIQGAKSKFPVPGLTDFEFKYVLTEAGHQKLADPPLNISRIILVLGGEDSLGMQPLIGVGRTGNGSFSHEEKIGDLADAPKIVWTD